MNQKEGYKNSTLYYPRKSGVSDGDNNCNYYWLASPSAYGSNIVLYVTCSGGVSFSYFGYTYVGARPVVSLNSGIKVNATDSE